MKLSRFKSLTYFNFLSIILLALVTIINTAIVFYFLKNIAINGAKEKAEIILDKNMSVHDYFTNELKPSLFQLLEKTSSDQDFFDPISMSSTHAIMDLDNYFNKRNSFGYYYKDAAINARSPKNEADEMEKEFLVELNDNGKVLEKSGTIEGKYYYIMKKGETMEESCLRCHTTPENAPKGLIDIYGNKKSFGREVGDIISIISIRIPIENTFITIRKNLFAIGTLSFILISLTIIIYYFLQKTIVYRPLELLTKKVKSISNNPLMLEESMEINSTKEISSLINSFNRMSKKLFEYQNTLEDKINEKTRSLEKKLEEINSLNIEKDKLFSIISHDLRNPVNGALNMVRIMADKKDIFSKEELIENHKLLLISLDKTANLLENLLLWAKSQLNSFSVNITEINISHIVTDVLSIMHNEINEKNIEVVIKPDDSIIRSDKNILEIVIRNVLANAVKFSNTGGIIEIDFGYDKEKFFISVIDNGIGIDHKTLNNLFNPGCIVRPGTKMEKGTGLGLILCREYLTKIDGEISIESEINKGTKVSIKIKMEE